MIPLRDDNPTRRVPIVTRLLIVMNVAAFIFELSQGDGMQEFLRDWGVVPGRLFASFTGETSLPVELSTVFTSLFLHGGWLHLIGNMWYLWIFGDNVEDRMGSWRFLGFYLSAGFVAALLHSALQPGSPIPTVGASGAIAGVLGAYTLAFPRARVMTLIPLFFFFQFKIRLQLSLQIRISFRDRPPAHLSSPRRATSPAPRPLPSASIPTLQLRAAFCLWPSIGST